MRTAIFTTCAAALLFSLTSLPEATRVRADDKAQDRLVVGKAVPDFEGITLDDKPFKLSEATERGPVALIVMRGFPGYDCPACSAQLADWVQSIERFKAAGVSLVIVYPGEAENLKAKAKVFLEGQSFPAEALTLVVDDGMKVVEKLGLRWKGENETAYPSTVVIDGKGIARWVEISREHGGRATARDALKAIEAAKL